MLICIGFSNRYLVRYASRIDEEHTLTKLGYLIQKHFTYAEEYVAYFTHFKHAYSFCEGAVCDKKIATKTSYV